MRNERLEVVIGPLLSVLGLVTRVYSLDGPTGCLCCSAALPFGLNCHFLKISYFRIQENTIK